MAINISGTSLVAPQVTNLAAKLFAVNPKLTVAQVLSIIDATATKGGQGLESDQSHGRFGARRRLGQAGHT